MSQIFKGFMINIRFIAVMVVIAVTLGCGGSSRHLLSATVTPATATASNSPNGIVQFTVTGMFDTQPSPAAIDSPTWSLDPDTPPDAVSINTTGTAQCKPGFVGTVTIQGGGMQCPDLSDGKVECRFIFGTAHLTCP